jgi:beta-glucanase (GH16 family)
VTRVLRRCVLAALLVAASVAAIVINSASSATAATGPNCGTLTETKPDGSAWTCTFADDFSTALDTSKWYTMTTAASGFDAGGACFMNSTQNVSTSSGYLNLTARKNWKSFLCKSPAGNFYTKYTAGEVVALFSQAYGRFEVRAAFPATTRPGVQASLWLSPLHPAEYGMWPWSGEIDIAEEYSQNADRAMPYVHYVPAVPDADATNDFCMITNISAFHSYVVEWTPDTITISYDGNVCIQDTWNPAPPLVKPQPFDQPFLLALTQTVGTGTNAPSFRTQLPATSKIDWVHIWS